MDVLTADSQISDGAKLDWAAAVHMGIHWSARVSGMPKAERCSGAEWTGAVLTGRATVWSETPRTRPRDRAVCRKSTVTGDDHNEPSQGWRWPFGRHEADDA